MPLLGSPEDMTDEQKSVVEFVKKRWEASDKLHKEFRDRWSVYYGLSRNYRRLLTSYTNTENDRDSVMQEFKRVFGEELFIPYIFTVIETTVPRIFATDPEIAVKPLDESDLAFDSCEPVKHLFERDAKKAKQALRLQETVRSGLRYGLGVQLLFWNKIYRSGQKVEPYQSKPGFKVEDRERFLVFEGPQGLSVDINNFRWDPIGYDLDSCGYVIHRTFRTMDYIKDRVQEGKDKRAQGQEGGWDELDLEKVAGMASDTAYGEVWADRMEAAGMSNFDTHGNELHEVWEYHDRDKVFTILDKTLLVQDSTNPHFHGDFPFQIYRPTLVEHEFVGIGEAEPIAHLQYELNTMRGQRRDAATLALSPPFFYAKGMLNPKHIAWGAGVFNAVDGVPDEVIKQAQIRDLPASSVSEEQALKQDIEMTTGISESSTGGGGEETATGTQLVQAAANQRIRQKVKNLHHELLYPEVCQRHELYKQNFVEDSDKQTIRVEGGDTPEGRAGEGYAFINVTPEHLHAPIEVEPVDGSTEAENEAQKKLEVTQFVDSIAQFADQLEPAEVLREIMRAFGKTQPERFLKPPGPTVEEVIPAIGATLVEQFGWPEEKVEAFLQAALQRMQQQPEPEGSEEQPPAGQSGSAPEPEPATVGGP